MLGMKKLKIIIPAAIAVVAVAVMSFSVALAQENENGDSNASKLAAKVAEILGLDTSEVDEAIKQARRELTDEAVQNNLNALVEKGGLTQAQADEYFDWIQSKPENIPAIGKQFSEKMGRHKGGKGHDRFFGPQNRFKRQGRFFGPPNDFKGERSFNMEDVQKKLNAMVEDGDITQEEAEAKLKALRAKEADRAATR
jgi:polyhydroxyalkanoate synthesis regulator phasin